MTPAQKKIAVVILALTVQLGGCCKYSSSRIFIESLTNYQEGKKLVSIYRPAESFSIQGITAAEVSVDGTPICILRSGTWTALYLGQGQHTVKVESYKMDGIIIKGDHQTVINEIKLSVTDFEYYIRVHSVNTGDDWYIGPGGEGCCGIVPLPRIQFEIDLRDPEVGEKEISGDYIEPGGGCWCCK